MNSVVATAIGVVIRDRIEAPFAVARHIASIALILGLYGHLPTPSIHIDSSMFIATTA